jgi:hypothetical protein
LVKKIVTNRLNDIEVKLGTTENGRNFGQGVENATAVGDGKEARDEHGILGS